ncbi:MAG: hypothetical protein ACNA8R_11625 [Nitriliruptoraceae bacterium]
MGYAVHHVDGAEATQLEDLATLEDALARVEALRNDGRASQVRVFKEIPVQVQTYYRVVAVDGEEAPVAEVRPEVTAPVPDAEVVEDRAVVDKPVSAPAAPDPGADGAVAAAPAVGDSPEPAHHREPPARLQPPPGAMLIAPARAAVAPAETRDQTPHRSLFSRS